jgi:hypothetical protein
MVKYYYAYIRKQFMANQQNYITFCAMPKLYIDDKI